MNQIQATADVSEVKWRKLMSDDILSEVKWNEMQVTKAQVKWSEIRDAVEYCDRNKLYINDIGVVFIIII